MTFIYGTFLGDLLGVRMSVVYYTPSTFALSYFGKGVLHHLKGKCCQKVSFFTLGNIPMYGL